MSGIPPDGHRLLVEFSIELGLEELTARILAGRLVPWFYDDKTGTWHQMNLLGLHSDLWDAEGVKRAAWFGRPVRRDFESWDWCRVFAAPAPLLAKHGGGPKPKYDREAQDKEMRHYVSENGPPKRPGDLVRHMEKWAARQDQHPSNSYFKKRVKKFVDTNLVSIQKAPPKPKNT
jgi:hypothetical protein